MASLGERSTVRVGGDVVPPGDKSISHRALILSALAQGHSRVRDILMSEDVVATAGALRALGWELPPLGSDMRIPGGGFKAPWAANIARLDCMNSGTTARLLAGVAAAQPRTCRVDGDASLRRRPMRRVSEPLSAMGASFRWLGEESRLPAEIRGGALSPLAWAIPVASAQVKSAILLAGLCAQVSVDVTEPLPTRDHTERMLRALGVAVESRHQTIRLGPVDRLDPLDLTVPGDPSSAAFFAVLAAGAGEGSVRLTNVLLNPHRLGFVAVLRRMGATVVVEDGHDSAGETVGDLCVGAAGHLVSTTIEPNEIPSLIDEIPALAVLAACAHGETRIEGAQELRVKESDRIATVVGNLRALGVDADERPDGLVVRGPATFRGAHIVTQGDHRMAMAFGVLGVLAGVSVAIDNPDCVNVSFPSFWSELERVTR